METKVQFSIQISLWTVLIIAALIFAICKIFSVGFFASVGIVILLGIFSQGVVSIWEKVKNWWKNPHDLDF